MKRSLARRCPSRLLRSRTVLRGASRPLIRCREAGRRVADAPCQHLRRDVPKAQPLSPTTLPQLLRLPAARAHADAGSCRADGSFASSRASLALVPDATWRPVGAFEDLLAHRLRRYGE